MKSDTRRHPAPCPTVRDTATPSAGRAMWLLATACDKKACPTATKRETGMEITAIKTALDGIISARDRINQARVDDAVREAVKDLTAHITNLQGDLLTLQQDHATALRAKDDAERRLVELVDWQDERARYRLHELAPGVFVYRLQTAAADSEPLHDLCPNCCERAEKSILQRADESLAGVHYRCPRCQAEFLDHTQATTPAV